MSELLAQIQRDLTAARKAQDKAGTLLLSTLLADLKNQRIELRRDLTDEDVREVLRRGAKRRREAVELYEQGNRPELAARERAEIAVIERYLPAQVGADELRAAVASAIAAGATSLGAVMGAVMPRYKGRVDGALLNSIAREELSKRG
ncbi:MAG TPA: GatB/YqeY domain-containing protein [Gemmatimonadaceae bacterium]|nr:GatB/YqeY domain-containing protein [Gemmatimonadaceae bacterium]